MRRSLFAVAVAVLFAAPLLATPASAQSSDRLATPNHSGGYYGGSQYSPRPYYPHRHRHHHWGYRAPVVVYTPPAYYYPPYYYEPPYYAPGVSLYFRG